MNAPCRLVWVAFLVAACADPKGTSARGPRSPSPDEAERAAADTSPAAVPASPRATSAADQPAAPPAAPPHDDAQDIPDEEEVPAGTWVATSHRPGCVFAGSMNPGKVALYASPDDPQPVIVNQWAFFRASRLELVADRRYPITVTSPVKAKLWVDPASAPFVLPTRMEIVRGHLWANAGARAVATRVEGDRARLALALPNVPLRASPVPDTAPIGAVIETDAALPAPVVACDDLALYADPTHKNPGPVPTATLKADAPLTIFDDARMTKTVARVTGWWSVAPGAHQGSSTGVHFGSGDFSLDGWVPSTSVSPGLTMGVIGLIGAPGPTQNYRRASARPGAAVRLKPDANAPVVFRMARSTELRRAPAPSGGFYAIDIQGFDDSTPRYFVAAGDLGPPARR